MLISYKFNYLYSAPWSPFFNPIEEFFSLLKHFIRKNAKFFRFELIKDVYSSLKKIEYMHLRGFIKHH